MAATLYIAGVDRTNLLQAGGLRINKSINSTHTATLLLLDKRVIPYFPVPGEHVRIEDDGKLIFLGQIESVETEATPGRKAIEHRIVCNDYTRLFNHYLVTGIWEYTTASEVIADILTPGHYSCDINGNPEYGLPGEGIIYVPGEPGISLEIYPVQSRTVYDVINELAQLSEYKWRLDYNKELFFYPAETNRAPISIRTGSYNYRNPRIKKHLEEYANEITVIGATQETSPQFAEYRGDGSKKTFTPTGDNPVRYNIIDVAPSDDYPTGCMVVDESLPMNDPNRRQHKILAMQGSAEEADFYFKQGSMDIIQAENAPPLTNKQILRVRYIGEFNVFTSRTDLDAVRERYLIEGGGALYQAVEQDPTILSQAVAGRKAESFLRARSVVPRIVTFETDQQIEPGCTLLEPGQVISLQINKIEVGKRSNPLLPDDFVIHNVEIEDVDSIWLRYTIECVGSEQTSWEDSWRKLAQQERLQRMSGDIGVQILRQQIDANDITDTFEWSTSDSIPWVGFARVGFCEVVGGVQNVESFIGLGMPEDSYVIAI